MSHRLRLEPDVDLRLVALLDLLRDVPSLVPKVQDDLVPDRLLELIRAMR